MSGVTYIDKNTGGTAVHGDMRSSDDDEFDEPAIPGRHKLAVVDGDPLSDRRSERDVGRAVPRYNDQGDHHGVLSGGERDANHNYEIEPDAAITYESNRDDIHEPHENDIRVTFDQVVSTVSDHGTSLDTLSSRIHNNEMLTGSVVNVVLKNQTRLLRLKEEHKDLLNAYHHTTKQLETEVERHEATRKEDEARLNRVMGDVASLGDRVGGGRYGEGLLPTGLDKNTPAADLLKAVVADARSADTSNAEEPRGGDKRKRAIADDGGRGDPSTPGRTPSGRRYGQSAAPPPKPRPFPPKQG